MSADAASCSWKDCTAAATHPQLAKDGTVWANLCTVHRDELERGLANPDPRTILRVWIYAQGGARPAAARMLSGMPRRCKCSDLQYRDREDGKRDWRVVGMAACRICRGRGKVRPCGRCDGTGMLPGSAVCPDCQGSALVPVP